MTLFIICISTLVGSGGATYRSAAVVMLTALHTVPREVPNTTAGVASLASAAEA